MINFGPFYFHDVIYLYLYNTHNIADSILKQQMYVYIWIYYAIKMLLKYIFARL